ncbi:hypothetical protein AB1Y20_007162 [Prymnesium parvum]|uniref:Uncharacterized protein n=1 Tax=Prymnesium parvum TaxID=97485 RepID=A0AB34IUP3_PRYPA
MTGQQTARPGFTFNLVASFLMCHTRPEIRRSARPLSHRCDHVMEPGVDSKIGLSPLLVHASLPLPLAGAGILARSFAFLKACFLCLFGCRSLGTAWQNPGAFQLLTLLAAATGRSNRGKHASKFVDHVEPNWASEKGRPSFVVKSATAWRSVVGARTSCSSISASAAQAQRGSPGWKGSQTGSPPPTAGER